MSSLKRLGEFGLIKLLQNNVPCSPTLIGMGDDAAVVPRSQKSVQVLTTDMLVEGVHFTTKMPLIKVGQKAMGASVSDVAAMGAMPKYALISLGVSRHVSLSQIKKIYDGINKMAKRFNISVVGGDTVKSKGLTINVAMVGEARKKDIVLRKGAKDKDLIFVTGRLGGSLKSGRHLSFTPRVKESQYLIQRFKPNAMIDISDGLAADLGHILESSKVGARLYEGQIPLHPKVTLNQALHDGEDFELLFTLSPRKAKRLCEQKHAFHFYNIGEITKQRTCALINVKGKSKRLKLKGFSHF